MINSCVIVGRLVNDPDLRYLGSGTPICKFRVACDRPFKDANGKRGTDFLRVVVFGKAGEACANNLGKGRLCGIVGRIQTDSYEKDGVRHNTFDIIANEVKFLDFPKKQDADPGFGYGEGDTMPWDQEAAND